MSSDNGYLLCQTVDTGKYGLFYWSGDGLPPNEHTDERAFKLWTNPITAMIEASEHCNHEYTEYGLHIHANVVTHAKVRWEIVQNLIRRES